MDNRTLIVDFIKQIWNEQDFAILDTFLHPDFTDHSLPSSFPNNKEGLKKWVIATGKSFVHQTDILDQVTEGDKTVLRIRMKLKHTGTWRGIEPTGIELDTMGYRQFKVKDGKIIEHRALIDGETIENKLRDTAHSCEVVKQTA